MKGIQLVVDIGMDHTVNKATEPPYPDDGKEAQNEVVTDNFSSTEEKNKDNEGSQTSQQNNEKKDSINNKDYKEQKRGRNCHRSKERKTKERSKSSIRGKDQNKLTPHL